MFQGKRAKPKTSRPSNDQHSCSQIAALGSKWETITGFTNECGTHRWDSETTVLTCSGVCPIDI